MATDSHKEALVKALKAKPGVALVTSPIAATPYMKGLLTLDSSLAATGVPMGTPSPYETILNGSMN
jgi:hypothetical protein